MVKNLNERETLLSFVLQNLINQIFVFFRETRFEPNDTSHDFVTNFSWMDTSERSSSVNKLIQKDSKRPNVKSVVVSFILYHLRGHVFQSSAECIPLLAVVRLNTPTKITNFYNISFLDQDIFRLDVSVNQTLFVHVIDTRADLNEKVKSCVFTQVFLFSNQVEQITLACVLKSKVNGFFVLETRIESTDILMVELLLDSYFSNQSLLDFAAGE